MSGVGKYVSEETREKLVFLPRMKFPLLRWTRAAASLIIITAQPPARILRSSPPIIRLAFSRFFIAS